MHRVDKCLCVLITQCLPKSWYKSLLPCWPGPRAWLLSQLRLLSGKSLVTFSFASVSASVLTTCLAGEGQAGCADRWHGFMTAIVGNSVNTGDAAFRSVSVRRQFSQPLPRLPCQTASRKILKPLHRAVCCLVLWPLPLQGCDPACYTFSQVCV